MTPASIALRPTPHAALRLCVALLCALLGTPVAAIDAAQLAVVINMNDPLSYAIGEYYVVRRHLPLVNIIKIRFEPGSTTMSEGEFKLLKASESIYKLRPLTNAEAKILSELAASKQDTIVFEQLVDGSYG